jgi:heme/copper-type cytochrome/quinol oxidase subunit 2
MSLHSPTKKDGLRSRIEYEDGLLNDRTGIFLVANSLIGVAAQLDAHPAKHIVIVVFAIAICIFWVVVGYKHYCVIGTLTRAYLKELEDSGGDPIEELVQNASSIWLPLRPTNILSLWLPGAALIAWLLVAAL